MLVLGIDPGRCTGVALIDGTTRENATLLAANLENPRTAPRYPDLVVIEKPVIYPHAKENPNDLITLAIQVGQYKEHFQYLGADKVVLVEARTWKGQVPKSVTMQRMCARFPNARALLDLHASGLQHNVSDAIGLAWWGFCKVVR